MLLRLPGTYPAQADTWLLAGVVRREDLARGRRVLDLFTGGGAVALVAARAGAASVTAVDLSRRSVLTARLNALLHRTRLDVRRGDLLAPVAGERFDLVVANPPYVPADEPELPRHRSSRSWDAGPDGRALLDRVCQEAPAVLAPGGALLVAHSAVSGVERTLALLGDAGLEAEVVARAVEPFGPVMRRRARLLEERGLIRPGERHEELVVVRARAPRAADGWEPAAQDARERSHHA